MIWVVYDIVRAVTVIGEQYYIYICVSPSYAYNVTAGAHMMI
jgi:hypothetical protein